MKCARGEGWKGFLFIGTIWLSVSCAEGRVAFVYTEARIALSVLSLVSCTNKKDELSFFLIDAESIMPHTATTDPASPLRTLPSPQPRCRMMALLRDPDSSTFP